MKECDDRTPMNKFISQISHIDSERATLMHRISMQRLEKIFTKKEDQPITKESIRRWRRTKQKDIKKHGEGSIYTLLPHPGEISVTDRRLLTTTLGILRESGIETKSDLLDSNLEELCGEETQGVGNVISEVIEAIYDVAFTEKILRKSQ